MSDDRDFIERTQSLSEKVEGRRMSQDELVNAFAMYSPEQRIALLETLDGETGGAIAGGANSVREGAEKWRLRQRLGATHDLLRKANR
jgi:hypothetical protein